MASKPSLTAGFDLPFQEQIDFFRAKLNLPTERWDDIWQAAHDRAFVVAGAMKADLLDDLRQAVDKAISTGTTLETFRKDFTDIVGRRGWQGWTGEGSPEGFAWRTKVIYETNLRSSYAAGRWAQLNDPDFKALMPFWRYIHSDSVLNPRPQHKRWGDMKLTLPAEHPFWKTHFPPNGWGCRCRVTTVMAPKAGDATEPPEGWDAIDERTGAPAGIDRGWAYAPGASLNRELDDLVRNKAASLPPPIAADFLDDMNARQRRQELAAAISSIGNEIAAGALETAVILDRSGNLLLRKQGLADAVEFSAEELAKLTGAVLMHNHPGTVPQSFSVEDINLAVHHRLAEIHAVDRLYHYSAADPGTWSPTYWKDTLQPVVQRIQRDVTQRLDAALAEGKITPDQYQALIDHMIWTEVDQEIGIGYQRQPRNQDV